MLIFYADGGVDHQSQHAVPRRYSHKLLQNQLRISHYLPVAWRAVPATAVTSGPNGPKID
jgi:hypothetical protein